MGLQTNIHVGHDMTRIMKKQVSIGTKMGSDPHENANVETE